MTGALWTWLQGYLVVRFRGPRVEEVLNAAVEQGISVSEVERLTSDIVIARLAVRHFRRLRPLLREYGVAAAIFERAGLPFVISGLNRRLFFIVGLLLSGILIVYFSTFVWFIEVTGSSDAAADSILRAAAEAGLYSGLPKQAFDAAALEAVLMARFPELAWVDVRTIGIKAVIEVVERQPDEYDPNLVGDIVARFGGTITDVFVARGTAQVRPGDVVQPGDVLISGTYYDRWGRRQQGRAQGAVWARVVRESFAEAPLYESFQIETGRFHRQWRLEIGSLAVPLGRRPPFRAYRTQDRIWQLKLGPISLPVRFRLRTYSELDYEERHVPRQAAEERALEEAWRKLEMEGADRTKAARVQVTTLDVPDAAAVRVMLSVQLEQNIGEFREN